MTPDGNVLGTGERYEVVPIELFFDLVFAFALSQLSGYLQRDMSWEGLLRTVVLFIAVYMVWAHTSWAATMIRADETSARWMILVVMTAGFFMNVTVPSAFAESGALFAGIYLIVQIGRTVWIIAQSQIPQNREHFWHVLLWQLASSPLWVWGAFLSPHARLPVWLAAALVDLAGPWLGHPIPGRSKLNGNAPFDTTHLLERCRLFRLIAMGEMIFATGDALSENPLNPIMLVLGFAGIVEVVALWELTFGRFFKTVAGHVQTVSNSLRTAHYAINALSVILMGLVLLSVANEHIVHHPFEPVEPFAGAVLCMGPLLFIMAQGWYLMVVPKVSALAYGICAGIMVVVWICSPFCSGWISYCGVAATLALLAGGDSKLLPR